ncbi:MAG: hypothetical protein Q9161_009106 [Pseudevernia consocians]
MGLIKTAIMTGGGVYAVNKLAKTVETRQSNPQYREQPSYYQERSRTPPQYQPPAQACDAPPGYWYSLEHDAYYPVLRAPQGNKSNNPVSSSQRGYQDQGLDNEQFITPPPYSSQRQIGYASPPNQGSERANGASSTFSRGDLAGQAMDFVMSAADGKKRNSGEGLGKRFG